MDKMNKSVTKAQKPHTIRERRAKRSTTGQMIMNEER